MKTTLRDPDVDALRKPGTAWLPRYWATWSPDERDLWHAREAAGAREGALCDALRSQLTEAQFHTLNEFDATHNERALLDIQQVAARFRRLRPDLKDLIDFAFDVSAAIHEDLTVQPLDGYIRGEA